MLNSNRLDNYNDISALQSLKAPSTNQDSESIKEVAKQFESLFVSMMLKSMRDANKGFSEGNMLSSKDTEFYQEMFDSQISVSLSGGKGFGLAEVIERQLASQMNLSETSDGEFKIGNLDQYSRKTFPAHNLAEFNEVIEQVDKVITAAPEQDSKNSPDAATVAPLFSTTVFDSPPEFVRAMLPHARKVESETGISARLMIAQSALETGWGQKPILNKDGSSSHNLFGIKAGAAWQGPKAEVLTTEFYDGLPIKQRAEFRSYGSYTESFRDYAQFLQGNPRYEQALALREDPVAFAQALQSSGYATDPRYANKIEKIMQRHIPEAGNDLGSEIGKR